MSDTRQAAVADFDGNGRLDVFLGTMSYAPRLFLQTTAGVFVDMSGNVAADNWAVVAAAAGDLDGDGDRDVLAFQRSGGGPIRGVLLVNDGNARMRTAVIPALALTNVDDVDLADVDNDRDLDALVAGSDVLLLNDGRGTLTQSTALPVGASSAMAVGDVDGDGDPDVLAASGRLILGGRQSRLYRNDGRGVFTDVTSTSLPVWADTAQDVVLVDLDGDRDLDAVISNYDVQSISVARSRVLRNDGRGAFADVSATHLPVDPGGAYGLAAADLDADGDVDVVFGGPDRAGQLYRNDGTGRLTSAPAGRLSQTGGIGKRIAVADLDGNGTADLVINGPTVQIYFGVGNGEFVDATGDQRLPPPHNSHHITALVDADVDGDLDRLDQWGFAFNAGDGTFERRTSARLSSMEHVGTPSVAADFDGDGDVDVAYCSPLSRMFLNDGAGNLTESTGRLPGLSHFSVAAAGADVDADGDVDLLYPNWPGATNSGQTNLLLNDGTGHFVDATSRLPANPNDNSSALATLDVDGDGDLDVLLGNGGYATAQLNRLFLNDGTGRFIDASGQLPSVIEYTAAIATGDVDGDRDLDVFLGMHPPFSAPTQNRLYLNDGAGRFTDVSLARLPSVALFNLAPGATFADLDDDGDLDLCIAEGFSQLILANNRAGFFTLVHNLRDDFGGDVRVGDIDLDGDPDVLGASLFVNGRRHLHAAKVARLGDTMRLEARHANVGAAFPLLPFVALRRLPLPLAVASLGWLYLDPRDIVALPPTTMATTQLVFLALPATPRLVGLTLHAQVVFMPPNPGDWRLSGLVSEPILR